MCRLSLADAPPTTEPVSNDSTLLTQPEASGAGASRRRLRDIEVTPSSGLLVLHRTGFFKFHSTALRLLRLRETLS